MEKILRINGDRYQILFSKKMISKKISELAARIKSDYAGKDQEPILIYVLTGAIFFGADMSKKLDKIKFRHHIDSIGLKRFSKDEVGGAVEIVSRPHANFRNRDVIVVEDVVDNGATMNFLNDLLINGDNPPRSIEYCILGLKNSHGPLNFSIKYLGFDNLGPEWIVGYGLDSNQAYRGLEDIWVKID